MEADGASQALDLTNLSQLKLECSGGVISLTIFLPSYFGRRGFPCNPAGFFSFNEVNSFHFIQEMGWLHLMQKPPAVQVP